MGKYLAILNGAASDQQKQELTPEQQAAFMDALPFDRLLIEREPASGGRVT